MRKNPIIVSLDIGGTKTRGIAVDVEAGIYLGFKAESSNLRSIAAKNLKNLFHALSEILEKNFCGRASVWCIGGAGIRKERDRRRSYSILKLSRSNASKVHVFPDFEGNWGSAFGGNDGIVSINGTGSVIFGRAKNNETRAGGWGFLLDEFPSGALLGQWALQGTLAFLDGEKNHIQFHELFMKKHPEIKPSREGILEKIYASKETQKTLGSFAPIFIEAFEVRNKWANGKVENSLKLWGGQMNNIADSLNFHPPVPWCGIGGLWESKLQLPRLSEKILKRMFSGKFFRQLPKFKVEWGPFICYQLSLEPEVPFAISDITTLEQIGEINVNE
ncbi:hypothetical protein HYY75_08545 [bacterium]|nr:hypothetical protein [bacterium]